MTKTRAPSTGEDVPSEVGRGARGWSAYRWPMAGWPWLALVLIATLVAAGCGHSIPSALRAQQKEWEDLRIFDYRFDLLASGLCGVTTTHIQVRGGQLVAATVEHPGCNVIAPTAIDGVFDFVAGDYRHGYSVKVIYDATYHFPASVSVDPSKHVIDDEYGLTIRDFQRL
jgi:Family of unknown function (DUF6174)